MKNDITSLSLVELSSRLDSREISSREATDAYLESIKAHDVDVGAYLTVLEDSARASADAIDTLRAKGEKLSPLAGVPMALKDNICTLGVRTTCASRFLENFVPPYNATVAEKLSQSVLLGKVNMDEFAMGSSTENSAMKITHNPRALDRVPGGSSGGSAAAVAAGEAAFALGSDTGGSIRQPAAFCGVVGLKPTYGCVSRYGLVAFASSLDQIGPITMTVADSALVLEAIAGHDERDSTSSPSSVPKYSEYIGRGAKGLRIGLVRQLSADKCQSEIHDAYERAVRCFEDMGANVIELSAPSLDYALPAYYVLSSAEASSNLARFDGIRYGRRTESEVSDINELYRKNRSEGFGNEVKRRIMIGTFALSAGYSDAYYKKALRARTLIRSEFDGMFEKCDVILAPTTPTTAYKIGEKISDPVSMYLGDIFTVPVNIAGVPAISIPAGQDKSGLPIGLQLIAAPGCEGTLLRAADALEGGLR